MTRTVYGIRNTAGVLVAEHVRVDGPDGKRMYWRLGDGTTGLAGIGTADLPLYGSELLPGLPVGETVVVTEGERAADAIRAFVPSLATVTGAAGTPGEDALAPLLPFDVVLWPDHDDTGRQHMARVASSLIRLGGACRILVFGHEKGDDAADWRKYGATPEHLRHWLRTALPYRPEPVAQRPSRPAYERQDDGRVQSARAHLLDVVTARIGPPKYWRQGTPWWCCPFHAERSPSFKVDMREPFYRCFGCDARGDVFTFLREIEGVEFKDAILELAPPVGLGGIPRMAW